jgi:hypothetical protein
MDYVNTIAQIEEDLRLILDVPIDTLSDAFLQSAETAELLKKAALGDLDALEQLRIEAAKDIYTNLHIDESGLTTLPEEYNSILDILNDSDLQNLEVGTSLDTTGVTDAFNELLTNGLLTVEQLQNIFDA